MNRRVILLLLVIVLGGGAALLVLLNQTPSPPRPGEPTRPPAGAPTATPAPPVEYIKIIVAAQELRRGMVIPEDGVLVKEWPVQARPAYGIADPKEAIGKIARTDIAREMPILSTQLVDNLIDVARKGSDAALFMPPGLVGIAVPIDRLSNVANAPKTGDYVDIVLSFLFIDVDETYQSRVPNKVTFVILKEDGTVEISEGVEGRVEPTGDFPFPVVVGPSETQRPRLVTQRTIQGAYVIYVGTVPPDGDILGRRPTNTPILPPTSGAGTPTLTVPPSLPTATPLPLDIILLAVEPQEAVALAWAIDTRLPITLLLRSAQDVGTDGRIIRNPPTTAVTLDYLMTTYNIPQPPKLPFALEPAIRSIRRLIISNEVSFVSNSGGTTGTTGGGQQSSGGGQ